MEGEKSSTVMDVVPSLLMEQTQGVKTVRFDILKNRLIFNIGCGLV